MWKGAWEMLKDKTCEETTGIISGTDTYIHCGRPAVALVKHICRREGPYFMCLPCADHNIRNRDAIALLTTDLYLEERWKKTLTGDQLVAELEIAIERLVEDDEHPDGKFDKERENTTAMIQEAIRRLRATPDTRSRQQRPNTRK